MANYTANNEEKYQIVCPYCFNEAAGGKPFSHKEKKLRLGYIIFLSGKILYHI